MWIKTMWNSQCSHGGVVSDTSSRLMLHVHGLVIYFFHIHGSQVVKNLLNCISATRQKVTEYISL